LNLPILDSTGARIASPDDPDIKAAAEIAAEAIMQSERDAD